MSYSGWGNAGEALISNGAGNIPTWQPLGTATATKIGVDTATGPGTNPVVQDGLGVINITGAQVSAGSVGANVIQTDSLAANTLTVEIQQSNINATKDTSMNGVAHYDSTFFTIDEGFVSMDDEAIATQYDGNTGSATPSGYILNIVGGSNVTTTASGNTVTIDASGSLVPNYIDPVVVATLTNLSATYNNGAAGVGATLTNNSTQVALSIDGVALSLNDRVLVWQQSSQIQNGVYEVTTVGDGSTNWVLTRTADYNQPAEINPGDLVPVLEGDTYAGAVFVETLQVTTIGTDPINFAIFQTTSGFSPWKNETGTSQTLQAWDKYIANNPGLVTFTLPTAASFGTELQVMGIQAGGWRIAQNLGQSITFLDKTSTVGTGGSIQSTQINQSVRLVCIIANTKWAVVDANGILEVV